MSPIHIAVILLCCFHVASSMPLQSSTAGPKHTDHTATTTTFQQSTTGLQEQESGSITNAPRDQGNEPATSTDHATSTTDQDFVFEDGHETTDQSESMDTTTAEEASQTTTTPPTTTSTTVIGHVVYKLAKLLATCAELFLTGIRHILGSSLMQHFDGRSTETPGVETTEMLVKTTEDQESTTTEPTGNEVLRNERSSEESWQSSIGLQGSGTDTTAEDVFGEDEMSATAEFTSDTTPDVTFEDTTGPTNSQFLNELTTGPDSGEDQDQDQAGTTEETMTSLPDSSLQVDQNSSGVQKRSTVGQATETSGQTVAPAVHMEVTAEACSTSLCYIWNTASQTREDTHAAFEHYCGHRKLAGQIGADTNHPDCESLARAIATDDDSDLVFPPVVDTSAQGTDLNAVLNLGLQATIEHQYLLRNLSALEEKDFCKVAHDFGMSCSADQNCKNPTQPDAIFFCDTHRHLKILEFIDLEDVVFKHQREMAMLGVADGSDRLVDIGFNGNIQGDAVQQYTLGGLYNTRQQMQLIQQGVEAVCPDFRSSCGPRI